MLFFIILILAIIVCFIIRVKLFKMYAAKPNDFIIRFKSIPRPEFDRYPVLKNQMIYTKSGESNYDAKTTLNQGDLKKLIATTLNIDEKLFEILDRKAYTGIVLNKFIK